MANNDFILVADLVEIYNLEQIEWTAADLGHLLRKDLVNGVKKNGNTYVSENDLKTVLRDRNKQIRKRLHPITV